MLMCLDIVQQLSQRCFLLAKWGLLLQELLQPLRKCVFNSSIIYLRKGIRFFTLH